MESTENTVTVKKLTSVAALGVVGAFVGLVVVEVTEAVVEVAVEVTVVSLFVGVNGVVLGTILTEVVVEATDQHECSGIPGKKLRKHILSTCMINTASEKC